MRKNPAVDSDEMYEVQFAVLSGYLSLTPTDAASVVDEKSSSPQSVMVFTGCDLNEDQLKDWLRSCGKQVKCDVVYALP